MRIVPIWKSQFEYAGLQHSDWLLKLFHQSECSTQAKYYFTLPIQFHFIFVQHKNLIITSDIIYRDCFAATEEKCYSGEVGSYKGEVCACLSDLCNSAGTSIPTFVVLIMAICATALFTNY